MMLQHGKRRRPFNKTQNSFSSAPVPAPKPFLVRTTAKDKETDELSSSCSVGKEQVVKWVLPSSADDELRADTAQKVLGCELVGTEAPSAEENWPFMTTKEKRRLWLKRRRKGEFYFRSELKGLVHAVRAS